MTNQDRSARTREAILAAAREEFSALGWAGARIDAIASRSGANKQRIYAYFTDKAGLFQAVQAEAVTRLAACEESVLMRCETDPAGLAGHLVAGYLVFHREHPEFWRLLAWANLAGIVPASGSGPRAAVLPRLRAAFGRAQQLGGIARHVAFEPWLVGVTAIVHFVFSNQRTAAINLGMPLAEPVAAERLLEAAIALLGGTTAADG